MQFNEKKTYIEGGATRDTNEGKPRPGLISPVLSARVGQWVAQGSAKYGDNNWRKGFPFSVVLDSLERHTLKFKLGMKDEDHLAAIAVNAMMLMEYEVTHKENDDLMKYTDEERAEIMQWLEGEKEEKPEDDHEPLCETCKFATDAVGNPYGITYKCDKFGATEGYVHECTSYDKIEDE